MTWLLTLLSGVLLGLSFPPFRMGGLEWVALVPLFMAVRRSGPLKAAALGGLSVGVASALIMYPLRSPEEWGNAGGACGIFAFVILWACAFGASLQTSHPWRWPLGVATAGVVGEWASHAVFPVYLALGQWRNPAIMPVASWVGVWGVSFLLYFTNARLALALSEKRDGRYPLSSRGRSLAWTLLLVVGLHLYGYARLSRPLPGPPLRVAALQPGNDDELPLLQRAKSQGAQLVVWPETALSEPLDRDLAHYRIPDMYQVVGYSGIPPVQGLPGNFASVVTPNGQILGRYGKIHLFGTEAEAHQSGDAVTVVDTPLGRSGFAICYDTMFTEVVRSAVRKGAQIVYVPNEDPEAGRGSLHALHAAGTVFRAAENGVPLVRSEWRGYSMVIDAKGRIVAETGMGAPRVVMGTVTLPDAPGTLYTRLGDGFPPVCLLFMVALGALEAWEERRVQHRAKAQRVEDASRDEETKAEHTLR
jgi:apolipoprotein N-acyltransferase